MAELLRVSFYGAGQVGTNTAAILRRREGIEVLGPFGRDEREHALTSGADVVVIATTSFLKEIADDIRDAVESGSNVITTAEEAAQPWANDPEIADRLDALARARGVSILGAGLNPGFAFDALVLTVCGAAPEVESLRVERVVDLSGFGETVLRRIGVGHTPEEFEAGKRAGTVTGHIGFPQSMRVVADRLGVEIDRIDQQIEPIVAESKLAASSMTVDPGRTAGFRQHYVAISGGRPWFEAFFTGHVAPREIGLEPRDEIVVEGPSRLHFAATPGMNPQSGSASIVANSIRRVIEARPGWVTVGELPPAVPR
jgi:2,4-diaminopentanoate dehydrogenase